MEKGLTEEMIMDLKNEIGNHEGLQKLGIKLKFTLLQMIEFDKLNKKNPFEGTIKMLSQWRKDTETKKQLPLMKTALISAGLKGVARSFFKVLEKESEKQKEKLRKASGNEKEGKAGKSTAIADSKPKTESTPAKKPAEKGSKTTETKPTSGTKLPYDGPKAGKSTAIADNKPKTESTPAKNPAQKGSRTTETKPTSGASTSKKSTSEGGNGKRGNGINAGKETAKKRKAPEEKHTPNKQTRKVESTSNQGDVRMEINTSESASSSGIKMVGQEVNITHVTLPKKK